MTMKREIISSPKTLRDYRKANDFCEACARLEKSYPVRDGLELHHIMGGTERTDEIWNLIRVCHLHHELATTHNLEYGSSSHSQNSMYFAIKILKGEFDSRRALDLGMSTYEYGAIIGCAQVLATKQSYLTGLRLGWYRK